MSDCAGLIIALVVLVLGSGAVCWYVWASRSVRYLKDYLKRKGHLHE